MFCRYISINIKAWCNEEFGGNNSKIIPAETHPVLVTAQRPCMSQTEQERNLSQFSTLVQVVLKHPTGQILNAFPLVSLKL